MPRKLLKGEVINDRSPKTISVLVRRRVLHPVYKKYIFLSKKYLAHDEKNIYNVGDQVLLQEASPISKRKKWVAINKITDGKS